jgi:hypothetical protein
LDGAKLGVGEEVRMPRNTVTIVIAVIVVIVLIYLLLRLV